MSAQLHTIRLSQSGSGIEWRWKLGSFASGGIPSRPPGYQFVLWDTNAKDQWACGCWIHWCPMYWEVSPLTLDFPMSFRDDNSPGPQEQSQPLDHSEKFPGTLRVKTIANSAGLHLSAVAEAEDGRNLYPAHLEK